MVVPTILVGVDIADEVGVGSSIRPPTVIKTMANLMMPVDEDEVQTGHTPEVAAQARKRHPILDQRTGTTTQTQQDRTTGNLVDLTTTNIGGETKVDMKIQGKLLKQGRCSSRKILMNR